MTVAEGGAAGAMEEARGAAGGGDDLPATTPIFTSLMFVDAVPPIAAITAAFRKQLWPSKRFGGLEQKDEALDESRHFAEEEVPDEDAARAWARKVACEPLPDLAGRPTWRLVVLRAPAPARSAVVVRMHRQVGAISEGADDLAELEAALGVPLHARPKPVTAKEERTSAKKRSRSTSPQKKEPKVRISAPGREPTAAELARNAIAEIEAETREPVDAKKALQAAIKACLALREVNSNQKGGGGCALYHENRILLYSAIVDLPPEHINVVKEQFERMGKAFQAKTASTYRHGCDEIEGYLRGFA